MRSYKGTKNSPSPGGLSRWQAMVTALDDSCLEYLAERHGHKGPSEAARYAVRQRDRTDSALPAADEPALPRAVTRSILGGVRLQFPGRYTKVAMARRQAAREMAGGDPEACRKALDELDKKTAGLHKFSGWMGRDDLERLGRTAERWNLDKSSQAFRLSVRLQAAAEHFAPEGGWAAYRLGTHSEGEPNFAGLAGLASALGRGSFVK